MIVDDDADDRYFLKRALCRHDPSYKFIEEDNAVFALHDLRTSGVRPDIIFMDINMPRLDGIKCMMEIRKDDKLKNIPVIVCSTSSDPRHIEAIRLLGASDYIVKPTDSSRLDQLINAALEKACN
jgi:CheY-like chemotaxis protein